MSVRRRYSPTAKLRSEASKLAYAEALAVFEGLEHAAIEPPVSTARVAELLGIEVKRSEQVAGPGHLVHTRDALGGAFTIMVRADLPQPAFRFVVAHEIGHAVLLRKHPLLADRWELTQREVFANTFACQLLVPPQSRSEFAQRFRDMGHARNLLGLASDFGLSPYSMLAFADTERVCFSGSESIWLRVKNRPNRFTGVDARLRVATAHYDRERYYVPTNQSVRSLCGEDDWLSACEMGGSVSLDRGSITVSILEKTDHPKYRRSRVAASLSATKLRASKADGLPQFLVLARR